MKKLVAIFILILLFNKKALYSQSYYFKHYQVENGLSNNTVLCSIQDNYGFMWFGTKDGLNRFDGYSFKTFRNDVDDKESLGDNYVRALYLDSSGGLYAGTSKGVYRYNEVQENFEEVARTNVPVREMTKDNAGNFWFVDGTTLKRIDKQTKEIRVYEPQKYSDIITICKAHDGSMWAASATGLLKKYNAASDTFSDFDMFSHSPATSLKWIEKIYPTTDGHILIGTTNNGLKIFNIKDSTYRDIVSHNSDNTEIYIRDFLQSAPNEYWIATESGIFIYNSETGKVVNLKKHYNNPYSISDNAIYTLCKDKEGGIWAGTYFGGINYYPEQYYSFEKFFPDYSQNAIAGNAVREICEDMYGRLWIGTEDGGLNVFNKQTGAFKKFTPTGKKTDIAYFNIHGLLCDSQKLWIGTFEHGLDIMDLRAEKIIKHYTAGAGAFQPKSNFILSIYKTKKGDIYLGTSRGLHLYNSSKDNFIIIKKIPEYAFVHAVTEDHTGKLWLATFGEGLFWYDPVTDDIKRFQYAPKDKKSIGSNTVTSIFEDSKNRVWVGTEGGGLSLLNDDHTTFTNYSTRQGFPSNTVFKILEDDKNNLWVTTTRGLVYFDPSSSAIKVYTKANGLLSDQFNYNSGYKDSTGRMYFGSVKGLISFNPNVFIENNNTPPVYITGFQVDNNELVAGEKNSPLKQSISFTEKIQLPYNKSSFSIDFAALSYTASETTEYAYKMNGLDKNWTYMKTNRKVYFTNLAPGIYTFQVKAANNSGIWSKPIQQLTVEILPPFWATKWAYAFYIVTIAVIIFSFIKLYDNRQVEKNRRKIELLEHEKEKEIYQAKIEFFTNVAHEIRTPLTLIKAPMEKLIQKAPYEPAINGYLKMMEKNTNRLVDLTNELLDFRKTETKGFSLNFIKTDITNLLEDIHSNFETIAEQKNLEYTLEMPAAHICAYTDAEALNKILSNLLNNAIKYADKKVHTRLLGLTNEDENFIIEIENDGYLIPENLKEKIFEPFFRVDKTKHQTGSGIGLALSRSLAELHKGKLYMKKGHTQMNIFVLILPVHQQNELNEDPAEVK